MITMIQPTMQQDKLKDIARLFLKLGCTAFGGPAAHIAMMQQEVVEKRKWLDMQEFLDLMGATYLIPGPNSTELAIHIGKERAGWKGLVLAGLCFILPAVLLVLSLACLYKRYGQLPQVQPFVYGIKPAILAIILAAIYPLAKKSLRSAELVLLFLLVLIGSLLQFNEILLMFGAGALSLARAFFQEKNRMVRKNFLPFTLFQAHGTPLVAANNAKLFWIFLKIGAILYGSGYVLFAFLDSELVSRGLLSRQQLMDAIAVGQFTPGPVFTSVTFIGYLINGVGGAAISTLAIFLPSFVFVALLNPLVKKMRGSKIFGCFLDAVNAASIAIIISICFVMGRDAIFDWRTVLITGGSLLLAFGYRRINSAYIVLGASVAGYLLRLIG